MGHGLGPPQSGKTNLAQSLVGLYSSSQTYILRFPQNYQLLEDQCDNPRSQLHVRECDVSTLCNGRIPDVALVTTAINNTKWEYYEKETAVEMARNVQQLLQKARVILVGTKYDLVSRGRASLDDVIQCIPSEVAYFYDLRFCAVSAITGEGIKNLKTEICTSASTL